MIDVTVTATSSHVAHAATMLRSMVDVMPAANLRVHLLHDGSVDDDDLHMLRTSLDEGRVAVRALAVPTEMQRRFPGHRFHISAWFRVLLPVLAPELDRALHVDVDAVVVDDVTDLWETPLGDNLFAAVANPLYPFQPQHWRVDLGLRHPREYLNSGVLLMDLARMRDEGLVDTLAAYVAANPDNRWPEQDALAATCRGRWLELAPRWNLQTTLFDLDVDELPYDLGEVAAALGDPAIVHYIGPYKPWTHACHHPLRHLYHHARSRTSFPPAERRRTRRTAVMRRLQEHDRARVALLESRLLRLRDRVRRIVAGWR